MDQRLVPGSHWELPGGSIVEVRRVTRSTVWYNGPLTGHRYIWQIDQWLAEADYAFGPVDSYPEYVAKEQEYRMSKDPVEEIMEILTDPTPVDQAKLDMDPEPEEREYINMRRVVDILLAGTRGDLGQLAREMYDAEGSLYGYLPKPMVDRFEALTQGWERRQVAERVYYAMTDGRNVDLEQLAADIRELRRLCGYDELDMARVLAEVKEY